MPLRYLNQAAKDHLSIHPFRRGSLEGQDLAELARDIPQRFSRGVWSSVKHKEALAFRQVGHVPFRLVHNAVGQSQEVATNVAKIHENGSGRW